MPLVGELVLIVDDTDMNVRLARDVLRFAGFRTLDAGTAGEGIALAAFATLVARPLALAPLLAPTALQRREAAFVVWAGLKGAVPILLAAFALGKHVSDAHRIYDIVFVVVLISVVVQGGSIATAARWLGIEPRSATRRA